MHCLVVPNNFIFWQLKPLTQLSTQFELLKKIVAHR